MPPYTKSQNHVHHIDVGDLGAFNHLTVSGASITVPSPTPRSSSLRLTAKSHRLQARTPKLLSPELRRSPTTSACSPLAPHAATHVGRLSLRCGLSRNFPRP